MSNKHKNSRQVVMFSPAERKIFIVFLYYLFSGALQLTTFSVYIRDISHNFNAIAAYLNCQRSGLDESCVLETKKNPVWALISFVVLFLVPVINLFFAMKLSDFKMLCKVFGCAGLKPPRYQSSTNSTRQTYL